MHSPHRALFTNHISPIKSITFYSYRCGRQYALGPSDVGVCKLYFHFSTVCVVLPCAKSTDTLWSLWALARLPRTESKGTEEGEEVRVFLFAAPVSPWIIPLMLVSQRDFSVLGAGPTEPPP